MSNLSEEEQEVKQDFEELRDTINRKIVNAIGVKLDSYCKFAERARFNNVYDKSKEDVIAELERYLSLFVALSRNPMPLGYTKACKHYLEELIERHGVSESLVEEFVTAYWGE